MPEEAIAVIELLEALGNRNIHVHSMESLADDIWRCDVSYVWRLNGWEKDVRQRDLIVWQHNGHWYKVGSAPC